MDTSDRTTAKYEVWSRAYSLLPDGKIDSRSLFGNKPLPGMTNRRKYVRINGLCRSIPEESGTMPLLPFARTRFLPRHPGVHPDRIARRDRDHFAVFAAILFPVFAQARAKGAADGLFVQYAANVSGRDDVRAGRTTRRCPWPRRPRATGFLNWHDLVDPYVKNKQIWICPERARCPLKTSTANPYVTTAGMRYYLNRGIDVEQYLFARQCARRYTVRAASVSLRIW